MRYFRRPLLAGKNLKRLVTASLRGNLRRNNPDVISTVPYFPDVVSGMSLDISTQTNSTTIYLTTNIFDTILAELRAGLAAVGATAFDDGGCVGISSTTTGSDGWVMVTGGTGAAAIGFDYLAQEFRSRGGDIGSAAEGRLGQPFGTALPNVGESFTTESVNRALGRVMANTDALYAESARCNGYMKMIATGTAEGLDALQELALPSDQKVFVDIPFTGEGIDERYLEPYFLVYDKYTNSRAQCRVTDVRSVEGGNSLIGSDHVVTQNEPIVEIKNGRVLKTEGSIFRTIAQVGDFVEISGSQNVDPWSNNGAMWVIEEIIDDVHLALRPMSYMELNSYGHSDSYWDQPVVELNTRRVGTQSLGTLTISRGPYATGAVLIFSPSMPIGMDYEIWAVVPVEENDNTLGHSLGALPPVFGDGLGVMLPNGLTAHPSVEMIGSDLFVSNFDVRVNSKGYHIPDTSFPASAGFTLPAYVYFDIGMMQVWWSPVSVGGGNFLPLAYLEPSGVVHPMSRIDGWANMATVGNSGQFANLAEAFSYLTGFDFSGDGVFELILLENQTPPNTNPWAVGSAKVRIRGASPHITLGPQSPDCDVFSGDGTALITLEGLTLVSIEPTTGFPGCTMKYVSVINAYGYLVAADGPTTIIDLGPLSGGVRIGNETGGETWIRNSLYLGGVGGGQIDSGPSLNAPLRIGPYQQTLLSLGRVGAETHVDGSVVKLASGMVNVLGLLSGGAYIGGLIDGAVGMSLGIGTSYQSLLTVGRVGASTEIFGSAVAISSAGAATIDGSTVAIDAAGALTIGTTTQTHLTIGRANFNTHILGTDVSLGVMGDNGTVYVHGDAFACRPTADFMAAVSVRSSLDVGFPIAKSTLSADGSASFAGGLAAIGVTGGLVVGSVLSNGPVTMQVGSTTYVTLRSDAQAYFALGIHSDGDVSVNGSGARLIVGSGLINTANVSISDTYLTFSGVGAIPVGLLQRESVIALTQGGSADAWHTHSIPHGNQLGGTLHAAADGSTAGFLTAVNQTIGGVKTFNAGPTFTAGAVFSSNPTFPAPVWYDLQIYTANWTVIEPCKYCKDAAGVVHIKGAVQAGATPSSSICSRVGVGGGGPGSGYESAAASPRVFHTANHTGATQNSLTVLAGNGISLQNLPTTGHIYYLDVISYVAEQ